MATSAFFMYDQFVEDLAKKVHNLNTDTLKVALTNTAPNVATHKVLGDITEITAHFGYSSGGVQAAFVSGSQTGGTFTLILQSVQFTGSGGTFGPFRYAVLYNSTPTSPLKPLIGYWDEGSSISVDDGESYTVSTDQTNGVLTISKTG